MTTHDAFLRRDPSIGLEPGELYLWLLPYDEREGMRNSSIEDLLCTEERRRAVRFHRAEDRHRFKAAHGFVRRVLSTHFAVPPSAWRFASDENGKPRIREPAKWSAVQFSLSHTKGLFACLVSLVAEAAVDVERIEDIPDLIVGAGAALSMDERDALNASSEGDRAALFYALWTLKEAYAKARGLGLSIPLDRADFALDANGTARVNFLPPLDSEPSEWMFWRWTHLAQHAIAVAAKKGLAPTHPPIVKQFKSWEEAFGEQRAVQQ